MHRQIGDAAGAGAAAPSVDQPDLAVLGYATIEDVASRLGVMHAREEAVNLCVLG